MAWIRDQVEISGLTNTLTPPVFDYVEGDLIIQVVMSDVASISWSTPTGYTDHGEINASVLSSAAFSKVATATEVPQVTSHGGTVRDCICYVLVIGDVDATTPINLVNLNDFGYSEEPQTTALSTTANECLVVNFFSVDTGGTRREGSLDTGLQWFGKPLIGSGLEAYCGWTYQKTLGGIYRPKNEYTNSRYHHLITFGIESGTTPKRPAHFPATSAPTEVIHPLFGTTSYPTYGGANRDVTGVAELNALINGVTLTHVATNIINSGGVDGIAMSSYYTSPSSGSAVGYYGSCWDMTSIDLAGKTVCCNVKTLEGYLVGAKTFADAGVVLGLRSSAGNYRLWTAGGQDTKPRLMNWSPIIFEPSSSTYELDEVGTFDPATVVGVVLAGYKNTASFHVRVLNNAFHILNTNIITGGFSTQSAKFTSFEDNLSASTIGTVQSQQGASSSQVISYQELQIGDGTTPVYFAHPNASLEFAASYNAAEKTVQLQRAAGSLGLTLYGVSGDTIDLSNTVMSAGNNWYYTIHASSTSAATWLSAAHTVIGATVTLQDVFVAQSGITFASCAEIVHNSADLSGGCIIDATTSAQAVTLAGSTQAALQALIDNWANCTFSSNAIAIKFVYTGSGDIALVGPASLTFTGNTVDLHYNSANESELTFTPGSGSNPSTTAASGHAGTTIVIDSAVAITLVAANLIDDTRYQIYNVTQSAELYNAVVSGGSGLSISTTIGAGLDIEVDDVLRLRATYGPGTTYKEPIESSIVANATSNVWINSQSNWTVVNDLSLDGSAQTEFTADYANDEVDITVAANFAGTELQAWWAYNLTTAQGISDFYGGVTLSNGWFLIHNAIVDIKIDNTTATNIFETANLKVSRDDEEYPVKGGGATSGGGGIDIRWRDPIYTLNTGGTTLTAQESAKLLALPDAAAIVDEWESQSQADPEGFHVNAKEINGVSIQGAGTEADPLRAVGVDP